MSTYLPSLFTDSLMDMFEDLDRSFFRGANNAEHALYGSRAARLMKTDIRENENGYELAIDLPGFRKEDIHLELNAGALTITAEKSLDKKDEDKQGRVLRQERYAGTLSRSFYVGDHISEDDVHAAFENVVLTVTIPKEQPKVPEKKTILIG